VILDLTEEETRALLNLLINTIDRERPSSEKRV